MFTKEYVINEHIKVVYVCGDNGNCVVVGDLPALPWCFDVEGELSVSTSKLYYKSIRVDIEGRSTRLVIEGAKVLGSLRSIGFVAYDVESNVRPDILYSKVSEHVIKMCEGKVEESNLISQ